MSDAPEYLPPYARSSRGTDVPLKSASIRRDADLEDDSDGDDLERDEDERLAPGERAPIREGLPPTYRMRHEPHYVEALVAPPVPPAPAVVDILPPSAASVEPTASGATATPVDDGATITVLAAALASIQASLGDLSLRGRPLRDRVCIDLARAEAARARWTADAAAVLHTDPLPSLDEVDLAGVCRAVAAAFAPEYRLAGGAPTMTMPATTAPVFGDERLLTTAVGAVLAAVGALVEDRGDAGRIAVAFAPRVDTANRTVVITQSAVRVPVAAQARFFDRSWAAHPAGGTGALLLAAARRIAEAHGGALELAPLDGGGCQFSLSIPAAG